MANFTSVKFCLKKHNRKSIILDRQDIIFLGRQYLGDIARYRSEKTEHFLFRRNLAQRRTQCKRYGSIKIFKALVKHL